MQGLLYSLITVLTVSTLVQGHYAATIGFAVLFAAIVILLDAARLLDNWIARRNVAKIKRRAL